MTISRRKFLASSTATVMGAGLTVIAPQVRAEELPLQDGYTLTAEYQDTRTDWTGLNEDTLIIRAEDFVIGSISGLIADEGGDHKHNFDVAIEDMEKLKRGETVQIRTSETYGHTHLIMIDPVNFKVSGGTIIQVKKIVPI